MSIPHLAAAQPPPNTRIVNVTPKLAEKWLGRNTYNRHHRSHVVALYARDMAAGAWQLNGETIKFATDGTLLDGQHRLLAVVESGATVSMLVVEGLPTEAQDTVDVGSKRTAADQLALHGEQYGVALASITRRAIAWQRSGCREMPRRGSSGQSATNHELFVAIEQDPSLRLAARFASDNKTALPNSLLGFSWWVLVRIDADDAEEFFFGLIHGEELVRDNPVLHLRDKLAELRAATARTPDHVLVALVFKAWNVFRLRGQMKSLRYSSNERFPVPR